MDYPYSLPSVGLRFLFSGDEQNRYEHSRIFRMKDILSYLQSEGAIAEGADKVLRRKSSSDALEAAIDGFVKKQELQNAEKVNEGSALVIWRIEMMAQTLELTLEKDAGEA